jgi:transcriptional regulator with XRE-family HTH domain
LEAGGSVAPSSWLGQPIPKWQLVQFGKLVRDKRNAAGFSRVKLARLAKLSDATIKFLETARHPPSRATLIRLIGIAELKLGWADVPWLPSPPAGVPGNTHFPEGERSRAPSLLNCYITPSYDALSMVAEFKRFLNGAGGHVEQTCAYIDPESAAAYLTLCQNSARVASLRARLPLARMAKQIVAASDAGALQVIALGCGDGVSETHLTGYLVEAQARSVELCLLDISQPLLSYAYQHAAEALASLPNVDVWAIQGNFHHLPLYAEFFAATPQKRRRRLFCMLGGTLANLDQELQFLRQSLLTCVEGDLLLLDVPLVGAAGNQPGELRQCDKLFAEGVPPQYAAWLGGPIWRHTRGVTGIDFSWEVETRCSVPGSYALLAMAALRASSRVDRRFSLFRFSRYDPAKLAVCLSEIGWEEMGAVAYAGEHSLRLYRKLNAHVRSA